MPICRDLEALVEAVVQWHVTWSTRGRQPVAPDESRRRGVVREIVARAGKRLVLFCVVDDHVHLWLIGTEAELRRVLRDLEFGLKATAAAPLEPRHLEVAERKSHREWLVGYLLTQGEHHGLPEHPAVWSGGAVADLLGARVLGWASRLSDALPRIRLGDVHAAVGLPPVRLAPVDDAVLREIGVPGIASAAAFATGADPALDTRSEEALLAVTAAARLCQVAELPLARLAAHLDRSREGVSRAASRPVPDAVLRAVRLRVALERAAVGAVVPTVAQWKAKLAMRLALEEGPEGA